MGPRRGQHRPVAPDSFAILLVQRADLGRVGKHDLGPVTPHARSHNDRLPRTRHLVARIRLEPQVEFPERECAARLGRDSIGVTAITDRGDALLWSHRLQIRQSRRAHHASGTRAFFRSLLCPTLATNPLEKGDKVRPSLGIIDPPKGL